MKLLIDRIVNDGKVLSGEVLKVDSFLNHQLDVELLEELAKEWFERFKDCGVTKILTIESSGIALAALTARYFKVPAVFAKKAKSSNIGDELYSSKVVSYTRGQAYEVVVAKSYISKGDRVLLIDDFLAHGSALKVLINLVELGGATVVGAGVAIEKAFQNGGSDIRALGYRVEALAKIKSMSRDGKIEFDEN